MRWSCVRAARAVRRRRRRPTGGRGSNPGARGRCPSGARASRRRRETSPRVLSCACRRADAASPATTTWCISGMLTFASKSVGGELARARLLAGRVEDVDRRHRHAPFFAGGLDGGAHHHEAAVGAGDGALHQQQVRARGRTGRPRGSASSRAGCPNWPAIRMPLNTRLGVAHAPIAPGERCFLCTPWLPPRPWNPWRFITPAKPLPFETPTTSTARRRRRVGPELLARLVGGRVVGAELDDVAPGSVAVLSKWPCMGLRDVAADGCRRRRAGRPRSRRSPPSSPAPRRTVRPGCTVTGTARVVVEDLGHPQLLAQDPLHVSPSSSTPTA